MLLQSCSKIASPCSNSFDSEEMTVATVVNMGFVDATMVEEIGSVD